MQRIQPRSFSALITAVALVWAGGALAEPAPNTLRVGLGGYSPVSYFEQDRPHYGSPAHRADHGGVTYFFADEAERQRFERNPAKYAPAFGGWCAYGMAVEGTFDADPTNYQIVDGRLYVFLRNQEVDTHKLWQDGDEAELDAKAKAYWHTISHPVSRAYLHSRNVSADGIGIDGYSPVSYFTEGKPQRGNPAFAVEHRGVTYLLTSKHQVQQFKQDPDRYVPAYGGWCAFGMAVQDKFPVDPTAFKIEDGRLLLFLRNPRVDALELWNQGDTRSLRSKADAHWQKVRG